MMTHSKNLKTFVIYCLLFLTLGLKAQSLRLDFKPKGQIIEFHLDSLTIYTDTSSLFYVYSHYADYEESEQETEKLRVKNIILGQFQTRKNDTAIFSERFVTFNDSLENALEWDFKWIILRLIKEKKVKIFDIHGQLVKTIFIKKSLSENVGGYQYGRRYYINKDTKECLFEEFFVKSMGCPTF